MQLFVLGATGRTGGEFVDLALARGHDVTAFVRSPSKVRRRGGLSVVEGDPRSKARLEASMAGHDAVVSAIGPKPAEAFRKSTLLTDVAASTVAAMTSAGVARLGIVSAALLFDEPGVRYRFFRWLLGRHVEDLGTMEAIVRASGLSWTIARPPRLVSTDQESYRAEIGTLPRGSFSTSFRSVAAFLLDAVERGEHVRQVVGVTR